MSGDYEHRIASLRRRIDAVDEGLLRLLAERVRLVGEAARVKDAHRVPRRESRREAEILARLSRSAAAPLDREAVRRIFRTVLEEGRRCGWTGPGRGGTP